MNGAVTVKTYPAPAWGEREIWRYAGCPAPDPALHPLLRECIDEIAPALSYRMAYREFAVCTRDGALDLGFVTTDSTLLQRTLAGCDRLVLIAGTVGLAPDRLIRRYGSVAPTKAMFFQAIGAERIEALMDAATAEMADGRALTPRVSPGYGDIPLAMQTDIFKALRCPDTIGLTLNDSLLMSPTKSVTALIGVKR